MDKGTRIKEKTACKVGFSILSPSLCLLPPFILYPLSISPFLRLSLLLNLQPHLMSSSFASASRLTSFPAGRAFRPVTTALAQCRVRSVALRQRTRARFRGGRRHQARASTRPRRVLRVAQAARTRHQAAHRAVAPAQGQSPRANWRASISPPVSSALCRARAHAQRETKPLPRQRT